MSSLSRSVRNEPGTAVLRTGLEVAKFWRAFSALRRTEGQESLGPRPLCADENQSTKHKLAEPGRTKS